jgi:hypothetical protein
MRCGGSQPSLRWAILLSIAIQLPLAVFLGHAHDTPLFMSAGYLAYHGLNPYVPADLSGLFGAGFSSTTSIGYPPPWILLSALLYGLATALGSSIFLYNFLLKLPLMAANLALALLVGSVIRDLGGGESRARWATTAMLFNPLVILTTTAWGQIDAVAALFSLLSLSLISRKKTSASALSLALALSIKPIVFPLILVGLIGSTGISRSACLRWTGILIAAGILLCALPFWVFGWDPRVILAGWKAQFTSAGGLSLLSFFELLGRGYNLPRELNYLGFFWLPALTLSLIAIEPELKLEYLLRRGLGLLLVFFLCRSWLSEPNLNAILPLAIILHARGVFDRGAVRGIWLIALGFSLLNYSLPQLFFLLVPRLAPALAALDGYIRVPRILARSLLALSWQLLGWRMAASCLRPRTAARDWWKRGGGIEQ